MFTTSRPCIIRFNPDCIGTSDCSRKRAISPRTLFTSRRSPISLRPVKSNISLNISITRFESQEQTGSPQEYVAYLAYVKSQKKNTTAGEKGGRRTYCVLGSGTFKLCHPSGVAPFTMHVAIAFVIICFNLRLVGLFIGSS